MELFRNRETGRYFIYVSDDGGQKVVLVNPYNKVKALKRDLFCEPLEGNADDFLSQRLVTEMQVKTYHEEISRIEAVREIEKRQASMEAWEKMTSKQKMERIKAALEKMSPAQRRELESAFDDTVISLIG
jgi:hypothetical protein